MQAAAVHLASRARSNCCTRVHVCISGDALVCLAYLQITLECYRKTLRVEEHETDEAIR